MESHCLMDAEFQFYKMKRVMGMNGGDTFTLWMYLIPRICTLKMVMMVNVTLTTV
jgi:hypothetical protein